MNISEAGRDLVKHFEGLVLQPYQCAAGVWTIGYGRTRGIDALTPAISKSMAEDWLDEDLAAAGRSVLRLTKVPLSQGQFDALVSFVFNLGGGAYQRSTLRQRLNRGDYDGAATEFMKWVWAGGRKQLGLVRRREAERSLFLA